MNSVVKLIDLDTTKESESTKVRLSEYFLSIEGEGLFIGRPTFFLRTFGCNFTCRGFSNPQKTEVAVEEALTSSIEIAKTDVGCDTIYSWHSAYRHLTTEYSVAELVNAIEDEILAKTASIEESIAEYLSNLFISPTGGEPMLHQKFWSRFLESSLVESCSVLFETNGTIPLRDEFKRTLDKAPNFIAAAVSPKLSNSGEPHDKAIKPKVIASYIEYFQEVYFKFVTDGSENSIAEIKSVVEDYNLELDKEDTGRITNKKIWLMPEGATLEQQMKSQKAVAEAAIKYGFNFSPRAHVHIWGNTVGT